MVNYMVRVKHGMKMAVIFIEDNYLHGIRDGLHQEWDKDGHLVFSFTWKNGYPITNYTNDGDISEDEFLNKFSKTSV